MKNILYVGVDSNRYGSGLAMYEVCSQLKKRGYKVYVILPRNGNLVEILKEYCEKIIIIPYEQWMYNPDILFHRCRLKQAIGFVLNPIAEKRIYNIIKKYKIDLVHINSSATSIGVLSAQRCSVPVVWHIREYIEEGLKFCFYNRDLFIEMLKKAEKVIAISTGLYSKYLQSLGKEKICLVYDGIKLDIFEKAYLERVKKQETIISVIGRITEEKNQLELIQAIQVLNRNNVIVRIVGDEIGEYTNEIKRYIIAHNMTNVIFTGYSENVVEEYKKADIVVVPSIQEGFGRITVEATVSGCVVIGANSGGTQELLQLIDGEIYQLYNINDLAEKIEKVMDNLQYYIQKNAVQREKYISFFSAERNCDNIIKVYNECLNNEKTNL